MGIGALFCMSISWTKDSEHIWWAWFSFFLIQPHRLAQGLHMRKQRCLQTLMDLGALTRHPTLLGDYLQQSNGSHPAHPALLFFRTEHFQVPGSSCFVRLEGHSTLLMHILKVTPVEIKATKILLCIKELYLFLKEIDRNSSLPKRLRLALLIYQNI